MVVASLKILTVVTLSGAPKVRTIQLFSEYEPEGSAAEIPLSYQQNGATAISILTDRQYFAGDPRFINEAREAGVILPILFKNFVVDELQVYEAAHCGASAVLLIATCMTKQECRRLTDVPHELGLEELLEMHDERELDYAELGPDVCGVNNRHLGTFTTDVETSFRLAERLPKEIVIISESSINNPQVVRQLRSAGYQGFLIGESFMREPHPGLALKKYIAQIL